MGKLNDFEMVQTEGFKGKISNFIENGLEYYGSVKEDKNDTYYAIVLGVNADFGTDDERSEEDYIQFPYKVQKDNNSPKTDHTGFYILKKKEPRKEPFVGKVVGHNNPPNDTKSNNEYRFQNMTVMVTNTHPNYTDLKGQILPVIIEIVDGARRTYTFKDRPLRKQIRFDVVEISPEVFVAVNVFED